ncbi:putative PPE family protein PPE32 [Mycobacterium botniense]|uniref:Putative PPE family protein PPE32 n=2 Tax=Mycobacterium botniense TaxID=84962 RepID=A0A7I9Y276_9MYCO|nr:putative PPE family protein PPE32 [Mycobacterium botniense]
MMYSGPGSGPMMAAAAAWDSLAADLTAVANSYQSVIAGLTGAWQGPSSASMTGAAQAYLSWLTGTAAQAEQAAAQAKAAGTAFETAFAATVPPPVIAANRAQLAALIATNFFGQNAAAIAATEAQYAEMWAQDVAMMTSYALSSAEATILQAFSAAPQVASGALSALQAAVSQAVGAASQAAGASNILGSLPQLVPTALTQLATPTAAAVESTGGSSFLSTVLTDLGLGSLASAISSSGLGSVLSGVPTTALMLPIYVAYYGAMMSTIPARMFMSAGSSMGAMSNMSGISGTLLNSVGQLVDGKFQAIVASVGNQLKSWGSAVTAQLAHATSVGGLSVPQAWSAAAPAMTRAAPVLPNASVATPALAPQASSMPGGPFGQALMGALSGRGLGSIAAKAPKVVPRSPAGG